MKFRDLRANEIDVRVGQVGDGYCTLLLYKDARVDMDILDETFGVEFWQREHYECKGNLFCKVGILCPTNKSEYEQFEWVWKADCGTESNTEKEKGESSDSFKRACVNWGIGRELYTAPLIRVNCATTKNDKGKLNVKDLTSFSVADIVIENKAITGLQIKAYNKENNTTDIVFSWGKLKGEKKEQKKVPKQEKPFNTEEPTQMTLEEAYEVEVNLKDGWKKLKDVESETLQRIIEHAKVDEWVEGARLILEERNKK